jgi:plastocyanin
MFGSPRIAVALPGLAAVGIFVAGCGIGGGCSRSVDRAVTASKDSARGKAPALPIIAPGRGAITGEVVLSGSPPTMQPLKRGVDPTCAKGAPTDEQVLVRNGKLLNVVVRVLGTPSKPAPSSTVVLDQEGCTFKPRVQGAVAGQVVEIRNSDGILHNVHGYADGKTIFNYAEPAQGAPRLFTAGAPGAIKLKCDVHPWMTAFIVVSPSSYYAVTGSDGAFSISGVADGTYQVEAWHERFGTKTASVTVRDGGAPNELFSYSTEDRGE